MAAHKIHHGYNIKRLREIMGMKQETLAFDMGDDWSQKKISLLEAKEEIDDKVLELVAHTLKVPVDAIKNYSDEAAIFNIQNNYEGANTKDSHLGPTYHNCTFNPFEKWIEAMEENKKLYERLLQSEREKVELLEKMVGR